MDFDTLNIFEYHDGEGRVFGDPLELSRRLWFELGDPQKVVDAILAVDPATADIEAVRQRCAASEKLCIAVRAAFEMKPFDRATGRGATDARVMGVWNGYCRWMADQKKSAGMTPTTAPPSASTPTPAGPAASTTTPATSA